MKYLEMIKQEASKILLDTLDWLDVKDLRRCVDHDDFDTLLEAYNGINFITYMYREWNTYSMQDLKNIAIKTLNCWEILGDVWLIKNGWDIKIKDALREIIQEIP